MQKLVWAILLSACLIPPVSSLAQDRTRVAEDLLRKSGAWQQLGDVAAQVRAGFEQGLSTTSPSPSPDELNRIAEAVESAYAPARLRTTAARVIADGLAEQDIADLLRWYESPTGVAITKLEEQASASFDDPRKVAAQGAAVLQQSTAQRRELLDSLVRETNAAEAGAELVINVAAAAQRGIAAATPGAPSFPGLQRSQLVDALRKLATVTFALTYETLTDDNLLAYLTFLKSPAGQHFNTLGIRALDAALSKATEAFTRSIPAAKDAATRKSAARSDQEILSASVDGLGQEALSRRR